MEICYVCTSDTEMQVTAVALEVKRKKETKDQPP
jgi:hypothetical protein